MILSRFVQKQYMSTAIMKKPLDTMGSDEILNHYEAVVLSGDQNEAKIARKEIKQRLDQFQAITTRQVPDHTDRMRELIAQHGGHVD